MSQQTQPMDSLEAPHLLSITNGQNHDVFDNVFGFEPYNRNYPLFEATTNGGGDGTPATKQLAASNNDIPAISIQLDMPMFHTNGNGIKSPPAFQITSNGDSDLPSAQVPPQIIYNIPSFTNFGSESGECTIASVPNNTPDVAIDSVATAVKLSTPKVSKAKVKPKAKTRTINYSNQKLILPNKEHIPLQSLLSPAEQNTNGVTDNGCKTSTPILKRKATKINGRTTKPKKKAVSADPTTTKIVDKTEFNPCFVYSEDANPEPAVVVPTGPSGVFAIAPPVSAAEPYCLPNGFFEPNDDILVNKFNNITTNKTNGVGGAAKEEHLVAMDFNFTEISLPGRSMDNHSLPANDEVADAKLDAPTTNPPEVDVSISLKMDGDNLVYEDVTTHTKLVYNLMTPEIFNLLKRNEVPPIVPVPAPEPNSKPVQLLPLANGENAKATKRRGRPRRGNNKAKPSDAKQKEEGGKVLPCSRTRYGRLSRPPRGMKIFADVDNKNVENKPSELIDGDVNTVVIPPPDVMPPLPPEEPALLLPETTIDEQPAPPPPEVKRQRNIERFKCLTCKKVYLGENKMFKHLKAFPDHKLNTQGKSVVASKPPEPEPQPSISEPQSTENLSIFDELMNRVRIAPKEKRAHLFFSEVSDFVERFEMLGPKLTASDGVNAPTEYLDKHVCKLLGIQEGNYQINEKVFDQNASLRLSDVSFGDLSDININNSDDFNHHNGIHPEPVPTSPQPLDPYNLLSLDGISNSKLNLSEGISGESLLLELVKERSKNLPDVTIDGPAQSVSYDHISDNAVEAVAMNVNGVHDIHTNGSTSPILDLSLDLFQFNSN